MRLSWSCGVIVGFIIAAALAGFLFYHIVMKNDPRISAESMQQVEKTWEMTKQTGDKAIESAKTYTAPPKNDEEHPPAETEKEQGI